ncbi:carbohydrate ABC transporter permease [Cellulosimicrobium cellulans]|uniref:carbohydrate ABC transporter permease n=1 Tax=Cellulosimicrobium cellulans TaxID=1710 RepID=UPI0036E91357
MVPSPPSRRKTRKRPLPWSVRLLLLPFVALFLATFVIPIFYSLWTSLFSVTSGGGLGLSKSETVFVGLENFVRVAQSDAFWTGMGRVLLYGLVQVPVMTVFALVLALVLDALMARVKKLFQLVYFLPYAVPGVVAALVWAYLYVPQLSPVVQLLERLGAPSDVFLQQDALLLSIANIATWSWTGYNMIIILAGLQAIPRDQFEAARLDGAGELRIAWSIKIPSVAGAIGLAVLMSIIGTVQLFNEPTILRTISNNIDSQYTPMMMGYNAVSSDPGFSSAIALSMALVTGVLVFAYYRLSTRLSR